ncbi:FMN reductase (NADPH) [Paenibacillus plantiphilus]|uniref:FMN reductase (NADPH) n=1 Tax=Paenibacillus plantiphilus TaxID=2905650 RepID=A0ABM9BZW3_9BACL|nr:NADPH-dependent FMN reductase [Paenibacillus plantiphilus]CAH1197615.1 FMN reductase (NADPH) [Paenibacillus plantiphilus]
MNNIVFIVGSPSRGSRLTGVLQYMEERLLQKGAKVDWIQVCELPAEDLIHAKWDSPAIEACNALVEKADAVIAASPVYKATYSGVLKTYLDLLPQKALVNKSVLPVFIGGTIAHLLSIEYGLKPTLSILGASHQMSGVYVIDSQVSRSADDKYVLDEEVRQRLDKAVDNLILP